MCGHHPRGSRGAAFSTGRDRRGSGQHCVCPSFHFGLRGVHHAPIQRGGCALHQARAMQRISVTAVRQPTMEPCWRSGRFPASHPPAWAGYWYAASHRPVFVSYPLQALRIWQGWRMLAAILPFYRLRPSCRASHPPAWGGCWCWVLPRSVFYRRAHLTWTVLSRLAPCREAGVQAVWRQETAARLARVVLWRWPRSAAGGLRARAPMREAAARVPSRQWLCSLLVREFSWKSPSSLTAVWASGRIWRTPPKPSAVRTGR